MEKVALITGAASGIGFALARLLARDNWTVILTDCNKEQVDTAAKSLIDEGGKCFAMLLDVTDYAAINATIDNIIAQHDQLNLVINSAGIAIFGEMKDIPIENWKSIINVNLWGAIYVTDVAYKKMIAQGSGHIVNISSAAGLVPSSMRIPYTTAKHGVVGLSTSLRAEAEGYGIKVSVVCPGNVKTNIFNTIKVVGASSAIVQKRIAKSHLMSADTAAKHILRGVARNKAIIPLTASAHIVWRLYRYTPGIHRIFLAKITENYRKLIEEDAKANK
ncbi:short-chain dehydrogenase/reductase SDR [Methanosarcina horonobensis HB-1 = JCM 15518]|uniref:Short-chain dehydrogenase/reductase SDR n=2 Tax=Methanosarcina horonobensis TaxID=418008 RepID=A0A0E3SCV0_9EURY|nr:SDR family NAD(P)-dependent oxidoreductase [Methanosarcina horonobensis]AKB77842.1 short-chain dehydrogenase/reductase SDR [Methanosarcina horonobensis HB-1 = JCM 15518]